LLLIFILAVLLNLTSPFGVEGKTVKLENPLKTETLEGLLENIINFVFNLSLVAAPLLIIIAGFYFVTSMGEPERIKTAKTIIIYTLVGFAIIMLAKGFVSVVRSVLEGKEEPKKIKQIPQKSSLKVDLKYKKEFF